MGFKGTPLLVFPRGFFFFFCLGDDFLSLLICHCPFLLWQGSVCAKFSVINIIKLFLDSPGKTVDDSKKDCNFFETGEIKVRKVKLMATHISSVENPGSNQIQKYLQKL